MLAILCTHDDNINVTKKDIYFVHANSSDEEDLRIECAPVALEFARKLNLKKVFLFYGSKGKIVYDYSL